MNIYETLKQLIENQRKPPMEIYLDETDGNKIKSRPLPKDMAASALINKTVNQYNNPAKLIHDHMFGY